MFQYFTARGYFLAIQIDPDDEHEYEHEYPYIGVGGSEGANFVIIKSHIDSAAELRANDDCYILFMSHMTDLLSDRTDPALQESLDGVGL